MTRSEIAQKAWVTIRANQALRAAGLPVPSSKPVTANVDRSDAAKRAWITIRANRAAKAAGLPVPVSASKSSKKSEEQFEKQIDGWLQPETPAVPEVVVEVPAPVEVPVPEVPVAAADPKPAKAEKRGRKGKKVAA